MLNGKTVTKRDGSVKPMDTSKIEAMVNYSFELAVNITPNELLQKLSIAFYDGIKTTELQKVLIHEAKLFIVENGPHNNEWSIVVGRLEATDLHGQIHSNTGLTQAEFIAGYRQLRTKKFYAFDISEEFLQEAQRIIDLDIDFKQSTQTIVSLKAQYVIQDKSGYIEYPQWALLMDSCILADTIDEIGINYLMFKSKAESESTPVKKNLRTGGNTASCFSLSIQDTIEDIFDTIKDSALISKSGGGMAVYVGKIRPESSEIDGTPDAATHVNKWVKFFDLVAYTVDQKGTRKGAITAANDWFHLDFIEFMNVSSEDGGDIRKKSFDILPQYLLNNYLLEKVTTKSDVYLVNNADCIDNLDIDLTELIGDEWVAAYNTVLANLDVVTHKKVNAYHLWVEMWSEYFKVGKINITNKDNINANNYLRDHYKAMTANLCVTGDTKILTKEYGYIPIEHVAGQTLDCWNGESWSKTPLFKTSDNEHTLRVVLSSGQEIEATDYHKWYVAKQDTRGKLIKYIEKRTHELLPDDKLMKFNLSPVDHGTEEETLSYENGFFSADGSDFNGSKIYLYNDKKDLVDRFSGYYNVYESKEMNKSNTTRLTLTYKNKLRDKFWVPDANFSVNTRLSWLAGYLDGDGTLTDNNGTESIQAASTNIDFLNKVFLLLQELGIQSKVVRGRDAGYSLLPNNNSTSDELSHYWCEAQKRLLIPGSELIKLLDLGYSAHRVMPTYRKYNRAASQFVKVEQVIDEDKHSAVYCGTEPIHNKLMFNGSLTGNCVESYSINTEKYDHTCNLISINLAEIITGDNLTTLNLSTPQQRLRYVVRHTVDTLNKLIDISTYPTPQTAASARDLRNIGIGMVGGADWLAYQNMTYNAEGISELERVMESITYYAYERSIELAAIHGSYPLYEKARYDTVLKKTPEELNKASLNNFDWISLVKRIKSEGIYNFLLTSPAPNAGTGVVLGATPNFLPVTSLCHFKDMQSMTPIIVPPFADTKFPYYRTRGSFDGVFFLEMSAAMQRWTDTGVSNEVGVNPDLFSMQDFSNKVIELMLKGELNAVYYMAETSCSSCAN